jgi:transposase
MQKKLPNKEFRKLVSFLKEEKIYEDKEIRKINWKEYTLQQVNETKETLGFIRESVDKTDYMPTTKPGKPLTNPKVLAKAILVCEFLGLTERKSQGWMEILGPFVGINEKLDDRVIGDAYDKPEVVYILRQIFDKLKDSNGVLAGDGTGLETSKKQNYESTKNKI